MSSENQNDAVYATLERLAQQAGFECMGHVVPSELHVHPEVRDMCASDRCHRFGQSWSCPPACDSVETYQEHISHCTKGIIVQSVGHLEDSFDIETIERTAHLHDKRFRAFSELVRACELVADIEHSPFFLGAGSCSMCAACTYPDAPCRFPEKKYVSLEAAGFVVNEVCVSANIPYNHGPNTISFSSGVFV